MAFYQEFLPENSVDQFIKCYWIYESSEANLSEDIIIHNGCLNIIFTIHGEILEHGITFTRPLPKIFVFPISPRPVKYSYGKFKCVGIRLQPWANYTFIKTYFDSKSSLKADILEFYNSRLADAIENHKSNEQIVELVGAISLSLVKFYRPPGEPFKAVIHKILEAHGELSIDTICDSLRITKRGVELKFQKNIGSSPKFFLQKIRFHSFLKLALSNQDVDLTQLALNTGYYDQSHLIHTSRKFTGMPPSRLVPILSTSTGLNKKINFSL